MTGNSVAGMRWMEQRRVYWAADTVAATHLRIELLGGNTGQRWTELAAAWEARIEDGYCTFNDVHAMLALVAAKDWTGARRLESALYTSQSRTTRYGEMTRLVGLPVGRALIAFVAITLGRVRILAGFHRRHIASAAATRSAIYSI